MIYFISSNTIWPSDKKKSVNLINVKQETVETPFKFGNCFVMNTGTEDMILTDSVESPDSNCKYYDSGLNELETTLKCGDILKQDLFSFFSSPENNDVSRDEKYISRALNFSELYQYENTDSFFDNLNKLIKLALKNLKNDIDTFFIHFSDFPEELLKDLKHFYCSLFKVLENFPLETFVIIIDPSSIKYLSFFEGLLENHEEDFSSEIIVRIKSQSDFTGNNKDTEMLFLNNVVYEEKIKKNFFSYIDRFLRTDITDLLIHRFTEFVNIASKDSRFKVYKSRLKVQLNASKNFDVNFCTDKALNSFIQRYLSESITEVQKRRFLFCFQRISVSTGKKAFDVAQLGNEKVNTWSKLNTLMKRCRFITQDHSDDYKKVKYLCGMNKNKNGYCIPISSAELKYFIFEAGICTKSDFDRIKDCLHMYGFAFSRFSLKDLSYEFVIKDSNTNDECDKANLYKKLESILIR